MQLKYSATMPSLTVSGTSLLARSSAMGKRTWSAAGLPSSAASMPGARASQEGPGHRGEAQRTHSSVVSGTVQPAGSLVPQCEREIAHHVLGTIDAPAPVGPGDQLRVRDGLNRSGHAEGLDELLPVVDAAIERQARPGLGIDSGLRLVFALRRSAHPVVTECDRLRDPMRGTIRSPVSAGGHHTREGLHGNGPSSEAEVSAEAAHAEPKRVMVR